MGKLLLIVALCVVAICITGVFGQTKPTTIPLNPEASAGVIQTEKDLAIENARHNDEVKRLTDLQTAYLKGAGVPKDYQCKWDVSQIVTCSPSKVAEAKKP